MLSAGRHSTIYMSRIKKKKQEKIGVLLKDNIHILYLNINQYLEKDNGMIESFLKIIKTFYLGYVTSQ